jgi:hypothetical protein
VVSRGRAARALLSLALALGVPGCTFRSYSQTVRASMAPRPVEPLRAAVLSLGQVEPFGPGESPAWVEWRCRSFERPLATASDLLRIRECYGRPPEHAEGDWEYAVWLALPNKQRARDVPPEARAEIGRLAEQLRQALLRQPGPMSLQIRDDHEY